MSSDDQRTLHVCGCPAFGRIASVSSPIKRAAHTCSRWFLSLYINSMPLIFAFRIVDCVLAMGVKVLFQIGLGEP